MRRSFPAALWILGCLVTTTPVRAVAEPVFLDTYGGLHSARSFLRSPGDERPLDAWQSWGEPDSTPAHRFLAGLFYRDDDRFTMPGGGFAVAGRVGRVGWSGDFFYGRLDPAGAPGTFDTLGVSGRLLLWEPPSADEPVVSLVGSFFDPEDLGRRWDLLLAADQRLNQSAFATLNVGVTQGNFGLSGTQTDLSVGLGATWVLRPGLSLSGDYVFENDVRGDDGWSVSATWAFSSGGSLRLGGGEERWFAAYVRRWDR